MEVLRHLPDGLCEVDGVIQRLGMIVNEVRSASLRRSINRTFLARNVSNRFWQEIGPQEAGRDYRGGHAEQTVEDAEWFADNSDLGKV